MKAPRIASLVAAAVMMAAGQPAAAATKHHLLAKLDAATQGSLVSTARPNERYFAVSTPDQRVLMTLDAARSPLDRATEFLAEYGALIGVQTPTEQLALQRVFTDRAGRTHVHLDQRHQGVPVFGARTVVHLSETGALGLNGVFIEGLDSLAMTPHKSSTEVAATAKAMTRKFHPGADPVIESSRLVVYPMGLLKGVPGENRLAYEVNVVDSYRRPADPIREQLFIDATTGAVLNRINNIQHTLNRSIHTPTIDVPAVVTEGSALAPADPEFAGDVTGSDRTPNTPLNNLYIYAGGTYDLYRNLFGREGYDDGDTAPEDQIQFSVYLVNENCPNAYWDGQSTNYCPGFDADDIVSHEWSHGYTEYTHGLIYQYQSGALNEAYSDIFGEMYDLVNGLEGPLGVTLTEGEYYENRGSRWVLGEDLSEVAAALLLRDMWDPDGFPSPSPGSVITSENYFCGTSDGGGVHTNSGVPNHAFAMLVDGKSFNGVDIPSIGMIKAANIYFRAMTVYQTPTTNFAQHADALEQSCADLIGQPLTDVFGDPSDQVIAAADCDAVAAAMLAVEMRQDPTEKCGYLPVLAPEAETPSVCEEGSGPVTAFSEDWESGALPAGWSIASNGTGDSWPGTNWEVSADVPEAHSGFAAFALDSLDGTCAAGGDISGNFTLDAPAVTVDEDNAYLSFDHYVQTEAEYDGGNLMYSVNGADFAVVPANAFLHNPHGAALEAAATNTNPKAGELAWFGSDQGLATGSWGTSIVDLSALAAAGDAVVFRWDFGQDGCNGNLGWYVDEVQTFSCKAGVVDPTDPTDPTDPVDPTDPGGSAGGVSGGGSLAVLDLLTMLMLAGLLIRARRSRRG